MLNILASVIAPHFMHSSRRTEDIINTEKYGNQLHLNVPLGFKKEIALQKYKSVTMKTKYVFILMKQLIISQATTCCCVY